MADETTRQAEAGSAPKEQGGKPGGREFGNEHATQAEQASANKGLAGENPAASDAIVQEEPE